MPRSCSVSQARSPSDCLTIFEILIHYTGYPFLGFEASPCLTVFVLRLLMFFRVVVSSILLLVAIRVLATGRFASHFPV